MSTKASLSKFISLVLRHKPEVIGIKLDKNGWANVSDLIAGINKKHRITMELLEDIVATDSKQRYSFNEDHTKIRANQGHSVNVDVELEEKMPPDILYHGTGGNAVGSIMYSGILPQKRLYVHLSTNAVTAWEVGARHGNPYVLKIDAKKMVEDGYKFYLSKNGVWMTKEVPPKYIF